MLICDDKFRRDLSFKIRGETMKYASELHVTFKSAGAERY